MGHFNLDFFAGFNIQVLDRRDALLNGFQKVLIGRILVVLKRAIIN
jgi:hypothetical protein